MCECPTHQYQGVIYFRFVLSDQVAYETWQHWAQLRIVTSEWLGTRHILVVLISVVSTSFSSVSSVIKPFDLYSSGDVCPELSIQIAVCGSSTSRGLPAN